MAERDHKAKKGKNMTNFKQTTRKDFWTGKKIDEFFAGQSKFYYIAKKANTWNYEKYWDLHIPVVIPTVPDEFKSFMSIFTDINEAKDELKKANENSFGWELYEGERVDNFMITHWFNKILEV